MGNAVVKEKSWMGMDAEEWDACWYRCQKAAEWSVDEVNWDGTEADLCVECLWHVL